MQAFRPYIQSRVTTVLMTVLLCMSLAMPAGAAQAKKKSDYNPRYASIVIDAGTGAVLHERYADKSLHPASLVKMMTLMMAFDALQNGSLTLNQRIRISNHAASQPPSKLGLRAGSSITVKDAIQALVTKSANDIAVAMGEAIGGTESQFVYMMNQRAGEIGMSRTRFQNASGLHHPNQVSSARDMAKLSRYLIANYPAQYRYFSTRNFYYNGASYHNHNRLMQTYQGMDGIKTGYIQPSGFNLAASAVRGNTRLIAVVFGGRSWQSRNIHVADLLDTQFDRINGGGDNPRIASAPVKPNQPQPQFNAPIPTRKPQTAATQLAMAEAATPDAETPHSISDIVGEGDLDPVAARRFEAGMMAIAAVKNDTPAPAAPSQPAAAIQDAAFHPDQAMTTGAMTSGDWSIQIGAFTSRVRSDQALAEAIKRLPVPMRNSAQPVIVPMQVADSWVYRARIRGLNREQAVASCKYFQNCMAISPRAF